MHNKKLFYLEHVLQDLAVGICRRMFFYTFDFDVLRAAAAYTFSTSQLLKMLRTGQCLTLLTWKCAWRHNGVHFFISHLAIWPRPSGATNHWKNTVNRDFPTFSRTCIFFFSLFLLSDLFTSFLLLSGSSHLCFSICPYCRKFDF